MKKKKWGQKSRWTVPLSGDLLVKLGLCYEEDRAVSLAEVLTGLVAASLLDLPPPEAGWSVSL